MLGSVYKSRFLLSVTYGKHLQLVVTWLELSVARIFVVSSFFLFLFYMFCFCVPKVWDFAGNDAGAFFDMYIGDVPVSEQTKEEIGRNVEGILKSCWKNQFRPTIGLWVFEEGTWVRNLPINVSSSYMNTEYKYLVSWLPTRPSFILVDTRL